MLVITLLNMDTFDTRYNNTKLEYDTTSLQGWTIKYQPGVWDHSPDFKDVFESDLAEIQRLLPPNIVEIMRDVVVYINISYRYPGHLEDILGACCHNSSEWLLEVRKFVLTSNNPKYSYYYASEWKSCRKRRSC